MTEEEYQDKWRQRELSVRATGRSTRQIDNYIQNLFKDGKIEVYDHAEFYTKEASVYLFDNIIRRLSIEHQSVKFKSNKKNISKLTIELLNFKTNDTTTTNG